MRPGFPSLTIWMPKGDYLSRFSWIYTKEKDLGNEKSLFSNSGPNKKLPMISEEEPDTMDDVKCEVRLRSRGIISQKCRISEANTRPSKQY